VKVQEIIANYDIPVTFMKCRIRYFSRIKFLIINVNGPQLQRHELFHWPLLSLTITITTSYFAERSFSSSVMTDVTC